MPTTNLTTIANLRESIRDAYANGETNPGIITANISARLADADKVNLFEVLLRNMIVTYGPTLKPGTGPLPITSTTTTETAKTFVPQPYKPGTYTSVPTKHVSAKFQIIASDWQRRLTGVYTAADGRKKPLGDFTYTDVVAQAVRMRSHAEDTLNRAKSFETLAEAMKVAGVATVSELPETVGETILP
jgi:hypothetical protein